jgi:RNA polymerase sigma-70 factor (ECF subfamily)
MGDRAQSEHELFCVLRAQSGSHDALEELFKILQEPLFRYVRSLVQQQAHAEDILQEVFIRIYRKLKWLREPGALRPWAYQIATRETFRYLKKQKAWSNEVRDEETLMTIVADPVDDEFSKELINKLPALINNLSPASRAVITLYYLHELSLSETAAVLEVPLGTVKSRLAYGLAALRKELGETNA